MISRFLFFIMISLLLVKCTDTETFIPNPEPETFKASAFVQVQDIHGQPLDGVRIRVGNTEGNTDKEGLLYLRGVNMYLNTYLTAEREGYFAGSRRFYPTPGKTHFVKIILLPEQVAGTIASGSGGEVQVSDVVKLNFPPDAVMQINGEAYNGSVNVLAQPIAADDPELSLKMPGDLVGFNIEGNVGVLGSFGMVTVELRSPDGDKLQVKPGSTVEMQMEVPSSMMSSAPSTIPMWYFDEEAGYWKEEGEASLEGNSYVAQLGHFSFWNCDAWFELVKWGATFVYEDGSPASQVQVCLTILDLQTTACSITNEEGLVCGLIAANELLLMEVKSPCGEVVYSQQIGPYSDTTMIGPVSIPSTNVSVSAVSGNAENCNNEPVTNGFAKIEVGDQDYFEVLDENTGEFSISVMNCNESDVTVSVVDVAAFKQSLPLTFSYATTIDAGTISVCETVTEFIDLEVVGFPDHYIYFFPEATVQGGITNLYAQDSSNQTKYFYVRINGDTPGTYNPDGAEVGVTLPNGDYARANKNDIVLTITYFGAPGDYILGNVSGVWHTVSNTGITGPDYPLAGTFSILRE